jgi:hypothetical protein
MNPGLPSVNWSLHNQAVSNHDAQSSPNRLSGSSIADRISSWMRPALIEQFHAEPAPNRLSAFSIVEDIISSVILPSLTVSCRSNHTLWPHLKEFSLRIS